MSISVLPLSIRHSSFTIVNGHSNFTIVNSAFQFYHCEEEGNVGPLPVCRVQLQAITPRRQKQRHGQIGAGVSTGYLYTHTHKMTRHCAWMYCVHRSLREGNSFTWHQLCNKQTALYVHHFGGYSNRAIKS